MNHSNNSLVMSSKHDAFADEETILSTPTNCNSSFYMSDFSGLHLDAAEAECDTACRENESGSQGLP